MDIFLLAHAVHCALCLIGKLLTASAVDTVAASEEALFACAGRDGYYPENEREKCDHQ